VRPTRRRCSKRSNSIKFHIGERDLGGTWRTVADRAELTRLGEGLAQHGSIADTALERTAAAIAGMVDEAKRNGVLGIVNPTPPTRRRE
jgi:exopolyphosphatase/guanosine-5'-triphosphate,3'-diphosphate pyrophosphatase